MKIMWLHACSDGMTSSNPAKRTMISALRGGIALIKSWLPFFAIEIVNAEGDPLRTHVNCPVKTLRLKCFTFSGRTALSTHHRLPDHSPLQCYCCRTSQPHVVVVFVVVVLVHTIVV